MLRLLFLLLMAGMLSACVSPMRLGMSEAEWRNYSPEEQQKIKTGYYEIMKKRFDSEEKVVSDGSSLHVAISGGKVAMPPFSSAYDYVPFEFDIASGGCKTITIKKQGDDKTIAMKACYRNKSLFLDPSRYDQNKRIGSIQLHYSPIWDRGFTYQNVSSSGYVHLKGVNVSLQRSSAEIGEKNTDEALN